MTLASVWTKVLRNIAPTLYQLSYGVSWQNVKLILISFHIFKSLRHYLSFVWNVWTTYFFLLTELFSLDVHSWFYLFSIVFWDISMTLLESMLLSLLLSQSKLDLPTLFRGSRERKNATEKIKNMTLARIWTQVLRHIAPTLYQLCYGVSWQNTNLILISFHVVKSLRHYLSFVWSFWTTYFF